ncbi:unnamed protein product [Malus baccata var. baccata]|uniref:60S acidic ribosomal protein P2 n=1 Tax=Malus domestica TaxID=3750 RepID=A0A498K9L3_MALDO|nr:hypothetical protein DVH24_026813 [Malus domestica]
MKIEIILEKKSVHIRLHIKAEMKVVAAYLLAMLGGKTVPSAEHLKDILGSVGAEADDGRI